MPKALIVWGGWEGHRPREQAEVIAALLREDGFDTVVTADYGAMGSDELDDFDLVVPMITHDVIERDVVDRLTIAVRNGLGLAGPHNALATSFRESVQFQFLCGVQWVAHPGDMIDFSVEVTRPDDPVMQGIPASFAYHSEQYYLHYDPSVEVLATTTFSGQYDPATTGVTMPVVFKRHFGKGRIFYSALGHSPEELAHKEGREILRRGLLWASRTATEATQ